MSEADLGRIVGIDQSSVSRALSREPPAWTPSLRKLAEYVNNQDAAGSEAISPGAARDVLGRAALPAWDGTVRGLARLVRLLEALRELGPERSPAGSPPGTRRQRT